MLADDRHGIVQSHHLNHPGICRAARSSTSRRVPPSTGQARIEAYFMPGTTRSMVKRAVPSTLGRCVQAPGRLADQPELIGRLERNVFGDRQLRGVLDQLAIAEALAVRAQYAAVLGAQLIGAQLPALGRGLNQQQARRRAGLAQRLPVAADRGRAAGGLEIQQLVVVDLLVRRGFLEGDLLEADLQLLGDHHRQAALRALAHLDLRHGEGDLAVAVDADEGIQRRGVGHRLVFRAFVQDLLGEAASGERQGETDHQPAQGQAADLEQGAARRGLQGRVGLAHLAPPHAWATRLMALRMRV